MPPFVAVGLAGAQALADFDHFLEPAGAAGGVDPGGGPFAPLLGVERAANPGADDKAAAGNQVDRGHSLGHQDGVAQGGQQHGSAKTHAAGAGCQGAQGRQRLQAGLGDQAVANPHGIQSGSFRPFRHTENAVGVGRRFAPQQYSPGGQQQAQLWLVCAHIFTGKKVFRGIIR